MSSDVIDECLNHVIESRVRRTYIRNRRPEQQARAFDASGDKLKALEMSAAGAIANDAPEPLLAAHVREAAEAF